MSEAPYVKGGIGEYREMTEKLAHGETKLKLDKAHERNIQLIHDMRDIKACWWYKIGKFFRLCP